MSTTLIGHRADGQPIHLILGGSSADPPPPAPPAGAPGYTPPTQAEWEATQQAVQRMAELQKLGTPAPPAADEDDDEDDSPPPTPRGSQDRSKPPSWDDVDKLAAALRKSAREQKAARERQETQQREWAEADAKRQAAAEQQAALVAAAEKAREEAEARYRPATIRATAMPALAGAKARPDRLDMIMGLIDQSKLTLEGDQVIGLDEQIAAVQAQVPEWFTTPAAPGGEEEKPRPVVPRVTTGDRPPADDERPERSADVIAQHILGGE